MKKTGKSRVGRVIAHGGDTVEITGEGEIKINGSIVMENNIFYDTYPYEGDSVTYPITLAAEEVFVLGDNRQGSERQPILRGHPDRRDQRKSDYHTSPFRPVKTAGGNIGLAQEPNVKCAVWRR